jgi:hypothetical protein
MPQNVSTRRDYSMLQDFSIQDVEKLKDELMLPAGELGAVLIAAVLVVLSLWLVPTITRPEPRLTTAASAVHLRSWMQSEATPPAATKRAAISFHRPAWHRQLASTEPGQGKLR